MGSLFSRKKRKEKKEKKEQRQQAGDMGDKENFLMQFRSAHKLHSVDFMRIWCHYDKSKTGVLEPNEVQKFLKDLIKAEGNKVTPGVLEEYSTRIMSTFDKNKDGKLGIAELARLLPVEHNFMDQFAGKNKMTKEDFKKVYDHYDKDHSGFIGGPELLAVLRDHFERENQDISGSQLEQYSKAVLEIYDRTGDGKLSFDELALLLTKTG